MTKTEIVRIFLSSPSDLGVEREKVLEIANEINRSIGFRCKRILEIVGWENVTPSIGSYAQQVINEQLDEYDIFLGIFALRFGTPTPMAGSGTEEEFNIALEKYRRGEIKDICMLFKQDGFQIGQIDVEQLKTLNQFKKKISNLGCYRVDFYEKNFDIEIRNLFSHLVIDWQQISTKSLIKQKDENHEEEDEPGYYDALNDALHELSKNDQVSESLLKSMEDLCKTMQDTKNKIEACSNEQMRIQIINTFSEKIMMCVAGLRGNSAKEKKILSEAMSKFNTAAKILAEDFYDGKQQLEDIILPLKKYSIMYEKRISSSQNLFAAIEKLPRLTTNLNRSKKELLKTLKELQEHSKELMGIFNNSLSNIKNYTELD